MRLRAIILQEHSKSNCDQVVKWVGNSQDRFDELFSLFTNDQPLMMQQASWPLSYVAIKYPALLRKHFGKLVKNLRNRQLHNAVIRNTLRILEQVDIPEKYHGEIINTCFDLILSPTGKPAIKAYSLSILQKFAQHYPEIRNELRIMIETQWDNESAAFRSRAGKILTKI